MRLTLRTLRAPITDLWIGISLFGRLPLRGLASRARSIQLNPGESVMRL